MSSFYWERTNFVTESKRAENFTSKYILQVSVLEIEKWELGGFFQKANKPLNDRRS